MSYTSEVLADSPDVYFRLDDTGAGPFVDVIAAHNATSSGTIINGSSLIPTDADASTVFDPTTTCNKAVTTYTVSQRPLTVEFWITPANLTGSAAAGASVAVQCGMTGGWSIEYLDTTGIWRMTYQGVAFYPFTLSTPAAIGTRQHVVIVLNSANTVDLYINGVFQQTLATGALGATANKLTIAGQQTVAPARAKATIDEVAVYKSALSASRILAHYTAATVLTIAAPTAGASADAVAPSTTSAVPVPAGSATASAASPQPAISVSAAPGSATASGAAPLVSVGVAAPSASSTAGGASPTVTIRVAAAIASATASAPAPALRMAVGAPYANATASAATPTFTISDGEPEPEEPTNPAIPGVSLILIDRERSIGMLTERVRKAEIT